MGKKTNHEYSVEFKQQAAQLANEIGITRAAKRLGIHVANIQRWKSNEKKRNENSTQKVKVNLEEENRRLNAENAELKKVNHILKAAAAFFSRDHVK